VKNKEGKEEPRKGRTTKSEKREGEMTNKVEKEQKLENKHIKKPQPYTLRPLEHLTGCGERGGNCRTSQESFHIICQGQCLDSKG